MLSEICTVKYADLTYKIRGAIYDVYRELGPGLFEKVYEIYLAKRLYDLGIHCQRQVSFSVELDEEIIEVGYRLDLLVEDTVIVEIKSVESLNEVHHKQLLTYLKLSKKEVGILVNFNTSDITKSIFRKVM